MGSNTLIEKNSINFNTFLAKKLENSIKIHTFAEVNDIYMKPLKVKKVIEMLKKDGWQHIGTKGDHRQFKHPTKRGRVTVNGHLSDTLDQELLNSIFKQAGWK